MFPFILLGAGLAGFLVGKKSQKGSVGSAHPAQAIAKEKERRIAAFAAYHTARKQRLPIRLCVATAKAVYQTKGGTDAAFIARLNSKDPDFLGLTEEIGRERRPLLRRNRKEPPKTATPPRKPPPKKTPPRPRRVFRGAPPPAPDFDDQYEQIEELLDNFSVQLEQAQGQQQGAPQSPAPAPQAPAPAPAEEEVEEEVVEFAKDEEAAAIAFSNALDAGADLKTAREKAKTAYQALGGSNADFLKRIETWSDSQ
jgi:hypothetical protein